MPRSLTGPPPQCRDHGAVTLVPSPAPPPHRRHHGARLLSV